MGGMTVAGNEIGADQGMVGTTAEIERDTNRGSEKGDFGHERALFVTRIAMLNVSREREQSPCKRDATRRGVYCIYSTY